MMKNLGEDEVALPCCWIWFTIGNRGRRK